MNLKHRDPWGPVEQLGGAACRVAVAAFVLHAVLPRLLPYLAALAALVIVVRLLIVYTRH